MLPGVYTARKKNGTVYYRASITFRNKHISLGSYSTESQAHQAYQEAHRIVLEMKTGLDSLFQASMLLPFEKQISLVNFRDNHIYFKNPIYLKNKYFLYFLSPNDELKFDIDDLFYYSNHKIMRRAGHLFVSDYGMQVNILSRYGIKNYAVAGKDYRFANGDNTDFRYSNIIILNKYYGVSQIQKNNRMYYKTKLHLTGNFTIGTYHSEETAAIAYNKAVDLAKKYGVNKNFMTNYITELSPREYAEIYLKIELSEKFVQYLIEYQKENPAS